MKTHIYRTSLVLIFAFSSFAAKAELPLTMGIFPYFDIARLAALHKPLKDHLAEQSALKMRLVSALNFKLFKQRTEKGQYDVLVTAPHLGRIAEKKAGYKWLAFTSNYSNAVFVSRRNTGITSIKELKGKTLALPPKPAIIHHLALNQLEKNGLIPGEDVAISTLSSHNNAMLAAIRGDNDAAAFGRPTWRRYNAPDKGTLNLIGESEHIPGFAIMVSPNLPQQTKQKLRSALYGFAETSAGKLYFDKTGLDGVREATPADMQLLDRYLEKIAKALKQLK